MAYPSAPAVSEMGEGAVIWSARHFGKNQYRIHLKTGSKRITMTGAAVTTKLPIPFAHRIVKIVLRHTDNASPVADSTDALSVILRRAANSISGIPDMEEDLVDEDNIVDAKVRIEGGVTNEYEASTWSLILNSTSTDYVYPVFYIQKLSKPEGGN